MDKKILTPPLPKWLLKAAKEFNLEIQQGNHHFENWKLDGWYVSTSGDWKVFWVADKDREKVGAKYLSPAGKGLQPTLILHNIGLVNKQNINDEILQQLEKEGLDLTEGVKGALALCASGFNACTIGGCNGGVATLKMLSDWGIPSQWIQRVFADTDILTNPKVLKGYKALVEACSSSPEVPEVPEVLVYPPQNLITDEGDFQFEKFSPDDWIEEGDDMEIVLKKVKKVNLQSIEQCHQKFLSLTYIEKNEIQVQRGRPNETANQWLLTHLDGRLMYLSDTKQFYYYTEESYWDVFNTHTLLDMILSNVEPIPFTYTVLENALKLVAPKFLKNFKDTLQLFSRRKYIGFQNGVWAFETSELCEPRPEHYISGRLPFTFSSVDPTQSLQTLCPKMCEWIVDRANHEEIYANILIAFLLLAVLDVRNPERFLFLSGYSATGKSTYLKLLQHLAPENKSHVTTSENIASNFGLQELTGISKTLLICHDIGATVSSAFVNLLRNLVSSGESQHVQRKFERAALMQFEGIVALASNKNPFTQQQREGIVDRRMIYVPFVNRVSTSQSRDFDSLFPTSELEKFASFAVQQDVSLIVQFIRVINEDLLVRQVLLESFKENSKALHIQNFITRRMKFCEDSWVPYGTADDQETYQKGSSLYSAYLRYTHEVGASKHDILRYMEFRQEFLPLLNRFHPQWEVFERRRYLTDQKRQWGVLNLTISSTTLSESSEEQYLNLSKFRAAPFWVRPSLRPGSDQPATRQRPGSDQP